MQLMQWAIAQDDAEDAETEKDEDEDEDHGADTNVGEWSPEVVTCRVKVLTLLLLEELLQLRNS